MKHWTVAHRITLGFSSVIIIAMLLGGMAYLRLRAIRIRAERTALRATPTVRLCNQLGMAMSSNVQLVYKHIGSTDEADKLRMEGEIRGTAEANTRAMEQVEQLNPDETYRELLERIHLTRTENSRVRQQVLALSRQQTNSPAVYSLARAQLDPATSQYLAALSALIECSQTEADRASKEIQSAAQQAQLGIAVGLGLALVVGVLVSMLIIRSTGKVLNAVVSILSESSAHVAEASGDVSSNSQSLAEGASEQAASLEETGASLEEMASMTKRTAENIQRANDLTRQARAAAEKGATDMNEMAAAMEAIKVSSDEIAKIIKTIDEIAFQTNILALNAAVEAARAGEAGMGFAVVADEVRNLSQRCAQAARETSAKIEGAVARTRQGVQISSKVSTALSAIVVQARQVDELVAEVAGASREQSQGIDQVNQALGQMDKVTQNNAASAEEAASAAEELNAQAETLKGAVLELRGLVGRAEKPEAKGLDFPSHSRNTSVRRTALDKPAQTAETIAAQRPHRAVAHTAPVSQGF